MALKDYNEKRKFDETSEPKGKTKKSKDQLIFEKLGSSERSFLRS